MKKENVLSFSFLLLALFLDFFLKSRQMHALDQSFTHLNRGFIFGSLQDLPPNLTLLTLTSFGGVLFSLYLLFIVLLSKDLIRLKMGLGFLVGGILGNVIDRALHGGTLDFIPLSLQGQVMVIFNPADVFQWLGAGFIAMDIFFKDKLIWYPANQRTFSLVHPKEQIHFALKFSAISFCTCVALGLFSMAYLTLSMQAANGFNRSTVIGFGVGYLAFTILLCSLAFVAGIILSQKSAGPLYAFEKYVESLLSGELHDLKLREGDNYKHLENVAGNLKEHFKKGRVG